MRKFIPDFLWFFKIRHYKVATEDLTLLSRLILLIISAGIIETCTFTVLSKIMKQWADQFCMKSTLKKRKSNNEEGFKVFNVSNHIINQQLFFQNTNVNGICLPVGHSRRKWAFDFQHSSRWDVVMEDTFMTGVCFRVSFYYFCCAWHFSIIYQGFCRKKNWCLICLVCIYVQW